MASKDSTTSLYNGRHTAIFKNSTHRYYIDGELKSGVTTIMGKVLAKPGLMLWPLNMALAQLKGKLPTIVQADLDEAAKAHIKKRDSGADVGTIVHGLVEQYLLSSVFPQLDDESTEVIAALQGFRSWYELNQPTVYAVEQIVYSHYLDYAGTFDFVLRINGKNYLCDLKTTNASREAPEGIYADYFIQLGAYLYAYNEERDNSYKNTERDLVQIDDVMIISTKKDGSMHTKTASEVGLSLDDCMGLWKATLLLYRTLNTTKKQLGGVRG